MPYNTRRKSLSLPSLGIHLPVTNAARAAAKTLSQAAAQVNTSTSSSVIPTTTNTSNNIATPTTASLIPSSQAKSSKSSPISSAVSAASSSKASSSASPSSSFITTATPATMPSSISPKRSAPVDATVSSNKRAKRRNSSSASAVIAKSALAPKQTPPSSPKRHASVEVDDDESDDVHAPVDMDGVVDDVVEGVVKLLQSSGNRPHLIKELENHLRLSLKSVQQSANPQAIICSRLSSFMKRPTWNATKKCPLAKQLENIHPRRTYYYLTTCRHQPLPDASSVHFIVPRTSIVTPPMSSVPSSSSAAEDDRRREISPSPEVDFATPGLDDFEDEILHMPSTPSTLVEYANHYPNAPAPAAYPRNQRGASPPLERDEKEFTQTAEGLQKQKNAGNRFMLTSFGADSSPTFTGMPSGTDATSLFGHQSRRLASASTTAMFAISSPPLRPMNLDGTPVPSIPKQDDSADLLYRYHTQVGFGWDENAELIGLDELESMLDFK